MKRFPLFCLAVLLGVGVSTPAQVVLEGRIGRHVVGQVVVGHRDHDGHHAPRRHRVHVRLPAPRGHWQTVHEQVLVPGYWQEQHLPPSYGWIDDGCGRRRLGMLYDVVWCVVLLLSRL